MLLLVLSGLEAMATHNRGGDITYEHLGGYTYRMTLMTCTYSESDANDSRDELPDFMWGDGTLDTLYRDSIIMIPDPNGNTAYNSQKNYYTAIHTYNGPGVYTMCIVDPNRNGGVANIANSINQPFAISSTLIISPFTGAYNNSIQLDECPCPELACVFKPYCYNIAAFDPDGDSLSYALTLPLTEDPSNPGACIPFVDGVEYVYPGTGSSGTMNGGGGSMSIDPITGTLCWTSPQMLGEFNFAIEVTEWRGGKKVGSVIRDIQLFVVQGDCAFNDAPDIADLPDTCIVAGDNLLIPIPFSDDVGANLQAYGEPFSANPPAFLSNPAPNGAIDTAYFVWNTGCGNVQASTYPTYFIAQDGGNPVQLQDIETMSIDVNGPAVTNFTVTPQGNGMLLNWDPNICTNISGYKIYRRSGLSGYTEDCCSQNAPELMGYTLLGQTNSHSDTSFFDNTGDLVIGNDYCYIVVACFGATTISCVSDQQCAQLKMDVPVITNVSVVTTDNGSGLDQVCWAMPKELDTLTQFNNHLFYYQAFRSPGNAFNGATNLIYTSNTSASLALTDTCFVDNFLNTVSGPYTYRVELNVIGESVPGSGNFDDTLLIGTSNEASSVFLSATPLDNRIDLSWTEVVPWDNYEYEVYKETAPGLYTLLATTTLQTYTDTGLVNGSEYCYKVRSIGNYSSPGIIDPIYNWSQIVCERPIDLEAPCPPELSIVDDCDAILNSLTWNNPNNTCADDVMSYNLYYAETDTSDFVLIQTFGNNQDTTYDHNNNDVSIAGCYYVTATDSVQYNNESDPSNIVCIDNCPYYWVPNIITPNNDGVNDEFIPFPYKFVESVDAKIYNRWGSLMFETTDPDIKWDGINQETGELVSDGVYYYVIVVNTIRLSGIKQEALKGHLTVSSDKKANGQ